MIEMIIMALFAILGGLGWHIYSEDDNYSFIAITKHALIAVIVTWALLYLILENLDYTLQQLMVLSIIFGWWSPEIIDRIMLKLKPNF